MQNALHQKKTKTKKNPKKPHEPSICVWIVLSIVYADGCFEFLYFLVNGELK